MVVLVPFQIIIIQSYIIQYIYCLYIIGSVGLTHPIDAQSDSDLGNLKAKTSWTFCHAPQTIPEHFYSVCGKVYLLKEATSIMEHHCHEGRKWSVTIFRCVLCVKVTSTWMSKPKVSQQNTDKSITLYMHWVIHLSSKKTWFIRQGIFFHCSIVQYWCSCAHCRHFWQWTGVIMSWLHSPIHSKLWCTVCSDTFLSGKAWSSSAVWATVSCPSLHHFYLLLLTITNHCIPGIAHENCHFGNALTDLASNLAIYIWPFIPFAFAFSLLPSH